MNSFFKNIFGQTTPEQAAQAAPVPEAAQAAQAAQVAEAAEAEDPPPYWLMRMKTRMKQLRQKTPPWLTRMMRTKRPNWRTGGGITKEKSWVPRGSTQATLHSMCTDRHTFLMLATKKDQYCSHCCRP
jgi:hypothetical protein